MGGTSESPCRAPSWAREQPRSQRYILKIPHVHSFILSQVAGGLGDVGVLSLALVQRVQGEVERFGLGPPGVLGGYF